ncbi:MAG: hypothetical protein NC922_03060 [Candidatus Omnitrophica bacterium]|nr:hypothetical protein [Candidatus Omnitrophota bacterium]
MEQGREFSKQSCIATILSWFDDLIENNNKKYNEIFEKIKMIFEPIIE